jgi:hypothetical protein
LLFLNEIGLDPGLDHLSAKKIIDDAKANGHEVHNVSTLKLYRSSLLLLGVVVCQHPSVPIIQSATNSAGVPEGCYWLL